MICDLWYHYLNARCNFSRIVLVISILAHNVIRITLTQCLCTVLSWQDKKLRKLGFLSFCVMCGKSHRVYGGPLNVLECNLYKRQGTIQGVLLQTMLLSSGTSFTCWKNLRELIFFAKLTKLLYSKVNNYVLFSILFVSPKWQTQKFRIRWVLVGPMTEFMPVFWW